ncbi:MAG: uracil-DNA glycosylase [Burkholderiaceae bacterium]
MSLLPEAQAAPNVLQAPLGQYLRTAVRTADHSGLGSWVPTLQAWLDTPQAQQLIDAVEQRQRDGARVYPAHVLHALALTPLHAVRVVILGQDPYHGPGQAQGLAFSVPRGSKRPPSLRNILHEVHRDLGRLSEEAATGDLQSWARQGVLLLNSALTVEDGRPAAHANLGWDRLVDALLRAAVEAALSAGRPPVLMLWGAHAQARTALVRRADPHNRCLVLAANHPSPLAARRGPTPFVGCGHFSKAAAFLAQTDPSTPAIRW